MRISSFLDKKPALIGIQGTLIETSTLENPFFADLVSLADPRSEYSYLNYCKLTNRIYSYYMRENHYRSRAEYTRYCQWVVARLPNLRFGCDVQAYCTILKSQLSLVTGQHTMSGQRFMFAAASWSWVLVPQPYLPACCDRRAAPSFIHSADYLRHKYELRAARQSP